MGADPAERAAALAGATVLANLSASNITIGKAETRRLLCQSQSARCLAAYLYAAAGAGESTTDLAWDGQASIFENGAILAESERFPDGAQMASPTSTSTCCGRSGRGRAPSTTTAAPRRRPLAHGRVPARSARRRHRPAAPVERFPFVPADPARLEQDCYEAYNIQVAGLVQRLRRPASSGW